MDISATILDLCDIHPYNGLQGRSLLDDAREGGGASAPAGVLIDGFGTFDTENGWLGFEDQIEYGAVTFAEEGYIGPEHHLVEEPGT